MEIGTKVICIDDSYVEGTAEELKKDCPNWVKKEISITYVKLMTSTSLYLYY